MRRRWSLRCVGWMKETVRDGHGAVMMYILMVMGLLTVVTTGVMLLISSDLAAGVRQLQAVRVFNVAEAGVHHAMGRLQAAGASSYLEETVPITDGPTVLGSAAVSVGCIDGLPLPCAGAYAAFRRVVSTGTLPVSGPSRTIVAVVEGFPEGLTGYAVCAYSSVLVNQGITIYGDVGSNGTITLAGPSGNYSRVRADPPPPFTNAGYYTGSARAVGAISCSVGCAVQVQGTTTPFAPGPVCPTVTPPTFSPGASDQLVPLAGWTMDATTGYDWNQITVASAGGPGGCTGVPPFSDLRIQTGAEGTTTVVNVRTLTMGRCARLIIVGAGRLDLRIGELTGQALVVGQYGRFGMLPTDTQDAPAPAPAGRVIVWVRSTAQIPAAVQIDRASIIVGTFIVPYGRWDEDRLVGFTGNMYGAVLAHTVDVDRDFVFTYDPTATLPGATFGNFTRLRSWKDQ